MSVAGGFTQTLDWLAFTLPSATVDEVTKTVGGDWFKSETGFRGYPTAHLMTQGKTGVAKLGTGAPRNPKEVHVDLSAGIVSQWDETKFKSILAWIFGHKGHVTRADIALDDRDMTVPIETVRLAVEAGQIVSRSKQFKLLQSSNHRDGARTGDTLYFGSRASQTMLRVYDKRLELQRQGREGAGSYGIRWELELKQDRAQACAKALLTLEAEDWREFLVGVLRSYVDFRETTRDAESYEKYRAPLLAWWETLTEGFRKCRLVVEQTHRRLDDVVTWMAQAISPMLAVVVNCRGYDFLVEMVCAGMQRWRQKHHALVKEQPPGSIPYVLRVS